jgi:uncharacterized protein (DUF1697 family)
MATRVALLRGINVGGHNKVSMADLRDVVTALGHSGVSTYIQSGNVLFSTAETDTAALAAAMENAIAERLGVRPRVVVLGCDDLAAVIRGNPYPHQADPKSVHAVFLSADPDPELLADAARANELAAAKGSRDSARVAGRTLYLHTPDGLGRSELAATLIARLGKAKAGELVGTARNWATVTKLRDLCDGA